MLTIAGGVILGGIGLVLIVLAFWFLWAIVADIAEAFVLRRKRKLPRLSSSDQQLQESREWRARNAAKKAAVK